jgi:ribosomal protection tetracycline resistance protein
VNDLKVNLIDTPGHADFIAEVERSFRVLDGAILLLSAVEGIQAQTKVLHSVLRELGIPTILFINKIDRSGAQSTSLVKHIKQKLTENVLPLYSAENIGTKHAFVVENGLTDRDFLEACIEQLALNDERLLASYVSEEEITEEQVKAALIKQISEAKLYPIFFGSAITGVGVAELLAGVASLFPANTHSEDAPLSGAVFKLEKEATGEKIAYIRVFSGNIHVREYVKVQRKKPDGEIATYLDKIRKLHLFCEGKTVQSPSVEAGEFCKVWGLRDVKIGDTVGEWSDSIKDIHFATPHMETRIEAKYKEKDYQLNKALLEIAEEDPLIQVLRDDFHKDTYIRIFGEVQKEVLETTLKEDYGLDVLFSETSIVCIEKPGRIGQALEIMGVADNPFYATVGFQVEPGPSGSGVTYLTTPGALPLAFYRAIEDTARATLKQGIYGWEVTDIVVTLTHTGYASPITTAGDFKKLVPLVFMEALSRAGTDVYEPINQFELAVPVSAISKAMFQLSALRAVFEQPTLQNDTFLLKGTLPVATAENFKRELRSFTEGEGVFMEKPSGFLKIENALPTRKRMDYNPLNRKAYLMHVLHVC